MPSAAAADPVVVIRRSGDECFRISDEIGKTPDANELTGPYERTMTR
jgi:hypothetical protein